MSLEIGKVHGLGVIEQSKLDALIEVYNYHYTKNQIKQKYYDGKVGLDEVNLGIALPATMRNLKVGCEWGAKAVDVLAGRSIFDGFIAENGADVSELTKIMDDNDFIAQYIKASKDELNFGCTFATLSADQNIKCKIRFHSPKTASALWSGEKGRVDCGMAIIDTVPDEKDKNNWVPSHINLYTDTDIWEITKRGTEWYAVRHQHNMGRPLMVAMVWNATSDRPFGRSRINHTIRTLIDAYVRTIGLSQIALEFATSPQKYLLGVTDDQYDSIVDNKFKNYMGSILAATANPETGANPTFGQLSQGSLSQHTEELRILAIQFSAATGLSVTDTGVVNDANPTSSDAILAQTQTLVMLAEQLNASNGNALKIIARMAQAIVKNVSLDALDDESNNVMAHFKNPAMPSVSVTADAAIKIASAREGFATTDTFLEMIGFNQADIRRIKAQESRARGQEVIAEFNNEETGIQ